MAQKLIQFRLDTDDEIDACVLAALEQCHASVHKAAKRLTQVYALAGVQHPGVNLKAAQQAVAITPVVSCVDSTPQPVQVASAAAALDPIHVDYEAL